MAETEKKVYVIAPVTMTGEAHGMRRHTGGNLHITKTAKVDPEKLSENEKKGMVYFPGEKVPAGIKETLMQRWIEDGNIITQGEYDKILAAAAKEAAKKKDEETKRR